MPRATKTPLHEADSKQLGSDLRREHRTESDHQEQSGEEARARTPENRSRTTALEVTIPAAPPIPWSSRKLASATIPGATAQAKRGADEQHQADYERTFPAVAVTQQPEKYLSDRYSDEARRQRKLD